MDSRQWQAANRENLGRIRGLDDGFLKAVVMCAGVAKLANAAVSETAGDLIALGVRVPSPALHDFQRRVNPKW